MTAPAPLGACYVRARRAVLVTVEIPGDECPSRRFRGSLKGAMYARGGLHHYRVVDAEGEMFLCPPHWIIGGAPALLASSMEAVA